jgi:hypothetical protein
VEGRVLDVRVGSGFTAFLETLGMRRWGAKSLWAEMGFMEEEA